MAEQLMRAHIAPQGLLITPKSERVASESAGSQYGIDSAELNKIITAIMDAHSRMMQLHSRVEMTSQQVGLANQSDSGALQRQKFDIWRQDFGQITSRLHDLNNRVKDLLKTGQAASDEATDHAAK